MSGKQPSDEPLLLVLDENIASEALRDALLPVAAKSSASVVMHTVFYPRETKDPVWMPMAAEQRWAVISADVSIKRRPAERDILINAGMCMYILRGSLNRDQIREALVKAVPAICRKHRQLAPPIICHISRDGDITVKVGERRSAIKRK